MYRESFSDIIFYIFVKWEKKINKCLWKNIHALRKWRSILMHLKLLVSDICSNSFGKHSIL